ncbi:MAG: hypothetical protein ACP5LN_11340 [Thermoproteota archaeon]
MPRNKKFESLANRMIDAHFHPKIRKEKDKNKKLYYIFLDYYFHRLVEQDVKKSRRKFMKYSLKDLLETIL